MHIPSKLSHTLLAASLVAFGGIAQAQTTDAPQQAGEASTMTQGVPNAATTNSPYPDGTVVRTYEYYSMPSAPAYVVGSAPVVIVNPAVPATNAMGAAAATSNVPDRAGEASTITGGVPNMATTNDAPYATLRYVSPGTYYLY